jgi:hypothetical protein
MNGMEIQKMKWQIFADELALIINVAWLTMTSMLSHFLATHSVRASLMIHMLDLR